MARGALGLRTCWATLAVAVVLWAGRSPPASAVEDAEKSRIRAVIERQLDAFRADDAGGAYALAAPSIRRMFPSAEIFLEMVRRGYPPVYRPRRHEFTEARDTDEGPEQAVRIDDAEGGGWVAVYSMERQPDGSWAISGCRLVKAPDQSV